MKTKLAMTVYRMFLGSVFALSGGLKLFEPAGRFLTTIHEFQLVHGPAARALSVALPWAELIFGVFLVMGLWSRLSLIILWGMNLIFIGALFSVLIRRVPVDACGCMGERLSLSVPDMLGVDLAVGMGFFLLWRLSSRHSSWSLDECFK